LCVPASSSVPLLGCIAWLIQPFVASGNSRFVGFCYDGPLSDSEAGRAESASFCFFWVTELERRWLTESPPVDRQTRAICGVAKCLRRSGAKSGQRPLTRQAVGWKGQVAFRSQPRERVRNPHPQGAGQAPRKIRRIPRKTWLLCDKNPTKMWVDTVNGADQTVNFGFHYGTALGRQRRSSE
jgi:hypothetical protein